MKEDNIKFIDEINADSPSLEGVGDPSPWTILVADDDKEVHAVTALALNGLSFMGRGLNIISAYSTEETKKLIKENPQTAVILLDVVMENHDSGLRLARYIREDLGNRMIRIILRTGQPGEAPELEVINSYDINDYKEKTELTSLKLVTTLIASLRNFNDLKKIEDSRAALQYIAESSAQIHGLESNLPLNVNEVLENMFLQFIPSLSSPLTIANGTLEGKSLIQIKGQGDFSHLGEKEPLSSLFPHDRLEELRKENILFEEQSCTILLQNGSEKQLLIKMEKLLPLSPIQKSIFETFVHNLSTVFSNIDLIEKHENIEAKLRQSLDEKLILVKEVHHRVKNNLQIISSLLNMQSSTITDKKTISVLRESEDRVQSMSLVHEKLYQSELMATIEFDSYIRSLTERLLSTYGVTEQIELNIATQPIMLSINTAIPCGLIVNEILTNAIKYAFPSGAKGILTITLTKSDDIIELFVGDNGIGIQEDLNRERPPSLGMKLIKILSSQIDGELKIENDQGTSYRLCFTELEEREVT